MILVDFSGGNCGDFGGIPSDTTWWNGAGDLEMRIRDRDLFRYGRLTGLRSHGDFLMGIQQGHVFFFPKRC